MRAETVVKWAGPGMKSSTRSPRACRWSITSRTAAPKSTAQLLRPSSAETPGCSATTVRVRASSRARSAAARWLAAITSASTSRSSKGPTLVCSEAKSSPCSPVISMCRPAARRASSRLDRPFIATKAVLDPTSTPTVWVCRVRSARAEAFGWKPRARIARSTRARVGGATRSGRLITRDTVWCETPAMAATSLIDALVTPIASPRSRCSRATGRPARLPIVVTDVNDHQDAVSPCRSGGAAGRRHVRCHVSETRTGRCVATPRSLRTITSLWLPFSTHRAWGFMGFIAFRKPGRTSSKESRWSKCRCTVTRW